MSLITVTRSIASGGAAVARRVAETLDIPLYDDDRLQAEAVRMGIRSEDLKNLEEIQETFEKRLPNLDKISIKADPKVKQGGCVVDTETGKIDARFETQLAKTIQDIRKELKAVSQKNDE